MERFEAEINNFNCLHAHSPVTNCKMGNILLKSWFIKEDCMNKNKSLAIFETFRIRRHYDEENKLGIGLGIDFYLQNKKKLSNLLKIKTA